MKNYVGGNDDGLDAQGNDEPTPRLMMILLSSRSLKQIYIEILDKSSVGTELAHLLLSGIVPATGGQVPEPIADADEDHQSPEAVKTPARIKLVKNNIMREKDHKAERGVILPNVVVESSVVCIGKECIIYKVPVWLGWDSGTFEDSLNIAINPRQGCHVFLGNVGNGSLVGHYIDKLARVVTRSLPPANACGNSIVTFVRTSLKDAVVCRLNTDWVRAGRLTLVASGGIAGRQDGIVARCGTHLVA